MGKKRFNTWIITTNTKTTLDLLTKDDISLECLLIPIGVLDAPRKKYTSFFMEFEIVLNFLESWAIILFGCI
jgi:hypothetical protein